MRRETNATDFDVCSALYMIDKKSLEVASNICSNEVKGHVEAPHVKAGVLLKPVPLGLPIGRRQHAALHYKFFKNKSMNN